MNNLSKGILNLNFVTITENDAGASGGGLSNLPEGSLKLQNSILGGNIDIDFGAPNCAGSITSLGYNLVQNPEGCGYMPLESDILNEDPWLIPMSDVGYGSLFYALWVVSPAIEHIPSGENGCGTGK